jgi:hypothetical protein
LYKKLQYDKRNSAHTQNNFKTRNGKMVIGSWIVSTENMRCKNWMNGIEITFTLSENNTLQGRISTIPEELFKEMPTTIIRAFYIYKMWRTATYIFKKIYLKKQDQHPQGSSLGYVDSPDEF